MAEKFLHKWIADINSYDNFEEVMAAMKLAPQAIAVFKTKAGTLEYRLDGDTWTALAEIEGLGVRTYVYKLGEEIDGIGLDGQPLKTKSRLEGDALIENSTSQTTNVPITITRRVNGDKLECTLLVDGEGKSMNYVMNKM